MSNLLPTPNQRYQLLELIGRGGMGTVYRAHDRLTGQMVALKQVQVTPQSLAFASRPAANDTNSLLLALAQEFRLLASLRHPNIISVLDYGFDANRQPYFTMELLDQPQTLIAAGRGQPLDVQIDLLIQTLQALAYLHRRGILHRDLKPDNVLVSQGQLRVLDFGLSVVREQANNADISGTLAYLAPEVLSGGAPSEATDLYAVGVMAYELFVGQHPFRSDNVGVLISRILEEDPDLGPLLALTPAGAKRALPAILFQLMEKDPILRYPSVDAVIADLCAVLGQPPPLESAAIRESFLQAATFVGREPEMAQLSGALGKVLQGQGSAWLIGGESGVGKSRLMDELRTQALVAGTLVVRGQAVDGGGLPYQLWREPLRRLVLTTTLSDLEAGVLKPIVPDIATLLERNIPGAPAINSAESLQRLVWAVTRLLQRQAEPLVLLFEDLQWAEESLTLLNAVVRLTAEHPILLVGNYRAEERPQLPNEAPGAQVLHLGRLSSASIGQLSKAMLGERGDRPEIVTLLEHETEGNTFFMVEVVRALAEGAGSLANIGEAALPAQVFTGGLQRLVERRLQRVPTADFPLLQQAAVIGRQIDRAALRLLATTELDGWLLRCADVAVLEVQGEEWRFAHDKLREGVLHQLSTDQQILLHRQAAACIQQAYATDLAPHASRLAEHYRQAGNNEQERVFAHQAGDYAKRTFAQAEAIRHYSRALDLTIAADERFILLLAREEIFEFRGERAAQAADLQALAQVVEQLADDQRRLEVLMRQAEQAASVAEMGALLTYAQQALALAQALGDVANAVKARVRWGEALFRQAHYEAAQVQFTLALEQVQAHGLASLAVQCLMWLSAVADTQNDLVTAYRLAQQGLQSSRETGDRGGELSALHDLGLIARAAGDWATAKQMLEEALHVSRQLGYLYVECFALFNLGSMALDQGEYDVAYQYNCAALPLARLLQNPLVECYLLGDSGEFFRSIGDFANAQAKFEQALQVARRIETVAGEMRTLIGLTHVALALKQPAVAAEQASVLMQLAQDKGSVIERASAWSVLGQVRLHANDLAAAAKAFQTSLELWQEQRHHPEALMALVGLAQGLLAQNQLLQAQSYVDELLAWQTAHPTTSFADPALAYLTCYQVLVSQQSARAREVLAAGYELLQRRAARISAPAQRQSYLHNAPTNRALLAAWVGEVPPP